MWLYLPYMCLYIHYIVCVALLHYIVYVDLPFYLIHVLPSFLHCLCGSTFTTDLCDSTFPTGLRNSTFPPGLWAFTFFWPVGFYLLYREGSLIVPFLYTLCSSTFPQILCSSTFPTITVLLYLPYTISVDGRPCIVCVCLLLSHSLCGSTFSTYSECCQPFYKVCVALPT